MTFQPFGYRFNLETILAIAEAKAILRAKKKGWFSQGNGARGWIIGPLLCLWWDPLNRQGPMMIGWMSDNGFGTNIRGRAGSDLNGVAMFCLIMPFLAYSFLQMLEHHQATTQHAFIFGGLLLLSPTVLWFSHKDRHEADPLVGFVRKILSARDGIESLE